MMQHHVWDEATKRLREPQSAFLALKTKLGSPTKKVIIASKPMIRGSISDMLMTVLLVFFDMELTSNFPYVLGSNKHL